MAFDFQPDRTFAKQIKRSAELYAYMGAVADEAATAAKVEWEAAGPHPYATGDYVDSIQGVVEVGVRGIIAYVLASDWKAVFIEYGTVGETPTEAFAPLRRGCDAIGLFVTGGQAT